MALSDKQRGVLRGVVLGAVITVVALGASVAFSPISLIPDPSLGERLAFVLKADTLIVVWLAICVARLGQHRFSTPEDIDPARNPDEDKAEVPGIRSRFAF